MWYGARLVSRGDIGIFGFFICFISVLFVSKDVGELFTHNPNRPGASEFYKQLTKLASTLRVDYEKGKQPRFDDHCQDYQDKRAIARNPMSVDFQNLIFAYPSLPEKPVLKDFSLSIESGQYVAFLGASGQGKSTIVSLLQGFYCEQAGKILIDGCDLQDT